MVQEIGRGGENIAQNIQNQADWMILIAQECNWVNEFHLIDLGQASYFNFGEVIIRNAAASAIGVMIQQVGVPGRGKDVKVIYPGGNGHSFPLENRVNGAGERIFNVFDWEE